MNTCKHPSSSPAHFGRRGRRAFSLIELLLVLVILAVLAALIMPRFTNRSEQARVTAAKSDIKTIETALATFEIDNGRFPSTSEGLAALMQAPAGLDAWNGPYLSKTEFKDPWGNAYLYVSPGQQNSEGYDLYSAGPNASQGDDDDITNW